MANMTKEDLLDANETLISPDPITGELITSADHKTFNGMVIDFFNSLLPIELTTVDDGNGNGMISDNQLINRQVSYIIVDNSVIQSEFINKPFASNQLKFQEGVVVEIGKTVIVNFKKQMM